MLISFEKVLRVLTADYVDYMDYLNNGNNGRHGRIIPNGMMERLKERNFKKLPRNFLG